MSRAKCSDDGHFVDLDRYEDAFRNPDGQPVSFDLESACSDIMPQEGGPSGYHHAFQLGINGDPIQVWIRWDSRRSKYWLSSRELSRIHDLEYPKVTLLHRLNRQQPFRIIVEGSIIFAYGQFYSIDLQLGREGGAGALVLGMLNGVPGLSTITSEKGDFVGAAATWPADSLFGLIDRELTTAAAGPFGPPFTALVCDDFGTEVADFIGVDDGTVPRVVFVAAKWKPGNPGAGASGLYDVSGQALKNLAYLKADAQELPGASRKWDGNWTLGDRRVPRRRRGPGSQAFRTLFRTVRANPAASREAWLVLGGGILSKAAVERTFRSQAPSAHVLQLFHLLLSLYAGCQSIGVELKVFCSE